MHGTNIVATLATLTSSKACPSPVGSSLLVHRCRESTIFRTNKRVPNGGPLQWERIDGVGLFTNGPARLGMRYIPH